MTKELSIVNTKNGARGIVVVKTLCFKLEGCGFETRYVELMFSIYLILPAAVGPRNLLSLWQK
jgi:hypothetical protein